jgi:hypothetical protein
VRVWIGDARGGGETGGAEVQRLEDAPVELAAECVAGAGFDDQAGEQVVGAGVRLVGAGRKERRV